MKTHENIIGQLGDKASYYLEHDCTKIAKDRLNTPDNNTVNTVFANSDRNAQVLRSLYQLYNHANLSGTGYFSILPVDQGIEHSASFSFYKNPDYFDPENIIKLVLELGYNAVAFTFRVLGLYTRKDVNMFYFIVKLNYNELLTYPTKYDQT